MAEEHEHLQRPGVLGADRPQRHPRHRGDGHTQLQQPVRDTGRRGLRPGRGAPQGGPVRAQGRHRQGCRRRGHVHVGIRRDRQRRGHRAPGARDADGARRRTGAARPQLHGPVQRRARRALSGKTRSPARAARSSSCPRAAATAGRSRWRRSPAASSSTRSSASATAWCSRTPTTWSTSAGRSHRLHRHVRGERAGRPPLLPAAEGDLPGQARRHLEGRTDRGGQAGHVVAHGRYRRVHGHLGRGDQAGGGHPRRLDAGDRGHTQGAHDVRPVHRRRHRADRRLRRAVGVDVRRLQQGRAAGAHAHAGSLSTGWRSSSR